MAREPAGKKKNIYTNKYIEEYQRVIRVKVNRRTEPSLLEWLEKQENVQGYIKQLVLEDMKRKNGGEGETGEDGKEI